MLRRLISSLFVLQLLLLTVAKTYEPSDICESIEIRSSKDFTLLRKCRIVIGHVHVLNVQNPVPEYMNSVVEEISDYLLVHRSHGLLTLRHMFPRLSIIRGRELFSDRYALIVYENRYMEDLGLISLMRIQRGNIRVEENPVLCYVHTINWVYLMGNSTEQHFHLKRNQDQNFCRLCSDQSSINTPAAETAPSEHLIHHRHAKFMPPEDIGTGPIRHSCWSFGVYQRKVDVSSCLKSCGIAGCDENGTCCSRDCLSGCSASKCSSCAKLRLGQKCVDSCSMPYLEVFNRECITESSCRRAGMLPYAKVCMKACPEHHKLRENVRGQLVCMPLCTGLFVVHTSRDLAAFKTCSSINGSVIIELTEMKSRIVMDLDSAFANVREITGYLKVMRSPQLVSFHFLRNLDTIRGDELIDNKYAFYVVDNYHLEHIWGNHQNVEISRGRIYFHLNPRLCHDKILKLRDSMKSIGNITTAEASPNSNGERVICGEYLKVLKPIVEAINTTAVRIKLEPWTYDDLNVLLGYMHRYKEAPLKNVTMYDGRHGCGQDNWHMDISYNQNVRHIIGNLKPNTQYAFFVRSITMTDYHFKWDAYSEIKYFKTLQSKPGPITKIYYHTETTTDITFHWWPPRNPNGVIRNYIVNLKQTTIPVKDLADDYDLPTKANSTCECLMVSPDDSGPLPKDENYFEQDKLYYEEMLPNIIYYSRPRKKKTQELTTTASSLGIEGETTITGAAGAITDAAGTTAMTAAATTSTTTTTSEQPSSTTALAKFLRTTTPGTTLYPFFETTDVDMDEETRQRIHRWNMYRLSLEVKAFRKQDSGAEDFPVVMPMSVCPFANANDLMQYQVDNFCVPLEHYEGIVVDGHQHTYTFDKLEPGVAYEFSIRACVEGLDNGCGKEATTLAKTASSSAALFFKENPSAKSIDDQSTYI